MNSLYNTDSRYTREADALDTETHYLLAPLFKAYMEKGYNRREISHVITSAVWELELDAGFPDPNG